MTFSDIMSLAANSCPRGARSGSAPDIPDSGLRHARVAQPCPSVPRRWIEVPAPRDPAIKGDGGRQCL